MSGAKKRAVSSRGSATAEASEVEEMLRAAEDELLMGLHVGSRTISSSLDPDLARRFEALKSPHLSPHPKATKLIPPPQSTTSQPKALETRVQIRGDAMDDDLMARFVALKGPTCNPQPMADPISNRENFSDDEESDGGDGGDKVSKKEVEKVMRWAMDAARLDPSVVDDEEDDVDKETDEEEDNDKELESEVEEKKRRAKGKGKPGKWFSLLR